MPTDDDFEIVDITIPDPGQGELLMQNLWFSVDPYHREEMDPTADGTGKLHAQLEGRTIGRVLRSGVAGITEGDLVFHRDSYVTHALVSQDYRALSIAEGVPLSAYLGILGGTGLTAWIGMTEICQVGPTIASSSPRGRRSRNSGRTHRQSAGASQIIGSTSTQEKAARLLSGPFTDVVCDTPDGLRAALEGYSVTKSSKASAATSSMPPSPQHRWSRR